MRVILAILLLGVIVLAGLWDIYAVARGAPQDTVSAILREWSALFPILPLIVGLIVGHIFWHDRIAEVKK